MTRIEKIIFTVFILLLSFVPLRWFSGAQILLGYDNVFPLNPADFLLDRFFSWTSTVPFGMDQSGIQGSLIVHLIDSIPLFLGASAQFAQKIVFVFWFFLIIISAYLLIVRLEKFKFINTPYLKYIFPVLYAFNFYILQAWWIAERTKFSLVVATPLILAIILPMLKSSLSFRSILKKSILCSFVLALFNGGGWVGFSLYGGLLVVLSVFYIFFSIRLLIQGRKEKIFLLTVFFLFFGLWFFLLNAYTLIPFLLITFKGYPLQVAGSGGISGLIGWANYLSENTSIINLLRLQGIPDWYNNVGHPYASFYLNNPLLILASLLFPLLIFLSFFKKIGQNRLIIFFFFLLFLTSFVFTAGTHKPLGFIPEFLMRHLPGFAIFRSLIFKFGYAYWLSASFLIGVALSGIMHIFLSKIKDKKLAITARAGLLFTIITLILVYHFPYFTGDIFRIEREKLASRVTVPSYVYDFSKWWKELEGNEKILLLPQLNKNWLFEQYTWNYLSLFPVLGNFANTEIVENSNTLSPDENELVSQLYNAINKQNYEEVNNFTSILGIGYFLVRKDYYYNLPNQKTDSPYEIERKLALDNNLVHVKSFGPWIVYRYKSIKPLIFAKSSGIVSTGDNFELQEASDNPLVLDTKVYLRATKTFSDVFVYPACVSCEAEKQDIQVQFPKPKILIDSPLYDFVQFRHKLEVPKNESVDQNVFRLLGESLSMIGQLNEISLQDKGEYYINDARSRLENILDAIDQEYNNVIANSSNPYSASMIIRQYLMAESRKVSEIIATTNNKNNLINLEKILYALSITGDRYGNFYSDNDVNLKKVFKFSLPSSGRYSVKVDKSSLGKLADADYGKINANIDGEKLVAIDTADNSRYLAFANLEMEKGDHELTINLPPQKNIFTNAVSQRLAGSSCYSSYAENFSSNKLYDLRFAVSNNFDPNFFYFIDDGEKFYPYLVYYFPILGNQIKSHRVIISIDNLPLDQESNTLRVSFCAPSLTETLYKDNIKDLSIVELPNPKVVLHKKENALFADPPKVDFIRVNQTHYKVSVKNAKSPYYLIFTQRFSPNWSATLGNHFVGNNYNNVWLIEKLGTYTIDLTYAPQRYFTIGAIISLFALITSLFLLVIFLKK